MEGKELYEEYHKEDDKFYGSILQECLKSDYTDSVLEIENKYPMGPTGYLTSKYDEHALFNAVDTVKAYTDYLQKITTVPVFGYLNEYKEYDNHEIEYQISIRISIDFKIHSFRRPSEDVDFKAPVQKLYANEKLSSIHKKFIVMKQLDYVKRNIILLMYAKYLIVMPKLNIIKLNMGVNYMFYNKHTNRLQ